MYGTRDAGHLLVALARQGLEHDSEHPTQTSTLQPPSTRGRESIFTGVQRSFSFFCLLALFSISVLSLNLPRGKGKLRGVTAIIAPILFLLLSLVKQIYVTPKVENYFSQEYHVNP